MILFNLHVLMEKSDFFAQTKASFQLLTLDYKIYFVQFDVEKYIERRRNDDVEKWLKAFLGDITKLLQ